MRPLAYVFDVPAQRLRASDRVIRCSEPELTGRTVLYVRSSRSDGAPVPYAPVSVITAPLERDSAELEEPIRVAWGTRVIVERIPEPDETYHVSALEPLPADARLEMQALAALQISRDRYAYAFGTGEAPAAGAVVAVLLDHGSPSGGSVFEDALEDGEMIEAWWYVDNHRLETPSEASAREAADLFADHVVRLRVAGADAGETCQWCGGIVTWTEHLPPLRRGEPARCNVRMRAVR